MIVLDTTVLAYAVGGPHGLRQASRGLVEAVLGGGVRATTTIEVIQEFAHVHGRRRPRAEAVRLAEDFALGLAPLISTDPVDLQLGLEIFGTTRLGGFDAVLAAATIRRGAEGLATADAAFAEVSGLRVLSIDGPELARLIA